MAKVKVTKDEEKYKIIFTQEGLPGISCHEGDLFRVIRAIRDIEYRNYCYGGKIGVSNSGKSVILYDLLRGKHRTCIQLTELQAKKLADALDKAYADVINSYSQRY